MQNSPELPSKEEEKAIAEIVETTVDFMIEQEHAHEILKCMVCEAGDLGEDGICDQCGAKTDI